MQKFLVNKKTFDQILLNIDIISIELNKPIEAITVNDLIQYKMVKQSLRQI